MQIEITSPKIKEVTDVHKAAIVIEHVERGKIAAIKMVRYLFDAGLKDSKDFIESPEWLKFLADVHATRLPW